MIIITERNLKDEKKEKETEKVNFWAITERIKKFFLVLRAARETDE